MLVSEHVCVCVHVCARERVRESARAKAQTACTCTYTPGVVGTKHSVPHKPLTPVQLEEAVGRVGANFFRPTIQRGRGLCGRGELDKAIAEAMLSAVLTHDLHVHTAWEERSQVLFVVPLLQTADVQRSPIVGRSLYLLFGVCDRVCVGGVRSRMTVRPIIGCTARPQRY
jgi:hypothetical protein